MFRHPPWAVVDDPAATRTAGTWSLGGFTNQMGHSLDQAKLGLRKELTAALWQISGEGRPALVPAARDLHLFHLRPVGVLKLPAGTALLGDESSFVENISNIDEICPKIFVHYLTH